MFILIKNVKLFFMKCSRISRKGNSEDNIEACINSHAIYQKVPR